MNALSSYSDLEIWNMFRAGNDKAYEHIYQTHAAELFSYGFYIAKDKILVEDCIHDLFVYLFQHRNSIGETNTIKYYLFKSLRRKILEVLEKQNRIADHHETIRLTLTRTISSPEEQLVEEESSANRAASLMMFIKDLPERQQEAIFLLYYSNLSYSEIASIMSLNVRTIYNHVHSGIETLRKRMRRPELLRMFIG